MEKGYFHGRDLRRGRVSVPGQVYHLTTVTRARAPVFRDFQSARAVIRILRETQALGHAHTLAFVVMPDHLHWLMQLTGQRGLQEVAGAVKSLSARRIGRGRLWQRGFHDHALRAEEDVRLVARYIVANPLRAGLVEHVGEYPHWDAIWL